MNQETQSNNNYGTFVKALFKEMPGEHGTLLHAAVGLAGETGELIDAVKKAWAYGKPLDRENVIEELGDVAFYLVAACNTVGITLREVIAANVDKLLKRYPNGIYSDQAAIARADKSEGAPEQPQSPASQASAHPMQVQRSRAPQIRRVPDGFVTISTASHYLGCADTTVGAWIKAGYLPATRESVKRLFIRKDDLVAFAKANNITPKIEL